MSPVDLVESAPAVASTTGILSAELLQERVRADVSAGLVAGVLGPGGCGKTALLAAVKAEYESAGVPVVDVSAVLDGTAAGPAAVLVDDAHVLTSDVLQRITKLVQRPGIRLVVAFRQWPRPSALTALASAIRRNGPLTVLQPLGREQILQRAVVMLGETPGPGLLDLLSEQTGGQPRVLDEVFAALRDTRSAGLPANRLPPEVTERLRFVIDDCDSAVRALLLVIAVGAKIETGVLSSVLGLDAMQVRETVDRVRAAGFLLGDGRMIPLFRAALLGAEPVERIRDIQVSLLDVHAGLGHDVVPIARELALGGMRNPRAADVLVAAADARLLREPAVALGLYADAIAAGASASGLAVRRAEASVGVGCLDDALQLADPVLAGADSADLPRAIDVVATVMAYRGQLGRAAELYRWLGPQRIGSAAPMAALALLATGERAEADAVLSPSLLRQPPTMLAGALALLAEGIQSSLTDSYTSSLSALSRAAALFESLGCTSMVLDSPAALTALVAVHVGEFDLAESVLRRAVGQQVGGPRALPRHELLLAWIAMLKGQYGDARALLSRALPDGSVAEPRDELLATALGVGLARRCGDAAELAQNWQAAREAILRQPIDLFVLLPLGEFVVTAARMGEPELLDTHLRQAWALLDRLGNPGVWASPLQWAAVQAHAVTRSAGAIAPLSRALDQVTLHNPYGRALAAASRAWRQVLGGTVDVQEVQQAAVSLQNFGLGYDAALLLGEAAARCQDRRATTNLLQLARGLHGPGERVSLPVQTRNVPSGDAAGRRAERAGAPGTVQHPPSTPRSVPALLSGRELEVAVLLLRNQTYREIGEKLFISPKTVEHHVARMKQRVGARRRSELFAELRVLTEGTG